MPERFWWVTATFALGIVIGAWGGWWELVGCPVVMALTFYCLWKRDERRGRVG